MPRIRAHRRTSFGVPPNGTGGDGAYRIDQPDDAAWLAQVLAGVDPRFGD
ncbi:MAG TPA: hypothetical protein VGM51_11375 [Armatimonadota bacterium]